jgi:hypothetical protein
VPQSNRPAAGLVLGAQGAIRGCDRYEEGDIPSHTVEPCDWCMSQPCGTATLITEGMGGDASRERSEWGRVCVGRSVHRWVWGCGSPRMGACIRKGHWDSGCGEGREV